MKINYEFVTGERLELEVDDSIGEIVIEMDPYRAVCKFFLMNFLYSQSRPILSPFGRNE